MFDISLKFVYSINWRKFQRFQRMVNNSWILLSVKGSEAAVDCHQCPTRVSMLPIGNHDHGVQKI